MSKLLTMAVDLVEQARKNKELKESGTFSGHLRRLGEHLINIRNGDKKIIVDKLKYRILLKPTESEREIYGTYLDAMQKAMLANNKDAVKNISSQLYSKIKESKEAHEAFTKVEDLFSKDFAEVIAFYRDLKIMDSKKIMENKDLSPEEKNFLAHEIEVCQKLLSADYRNPFTGAERLSTKPLLSEMRNILADHLHYQNKTNMVEQTDPDTGEITYLHPVTNESYYKDQSGNFKKASFRTRLKKLAFYTKGY